MVKQLEAELQMQKKNRRYQSIEYKKGGSKV
jgi:hypothetical protein